MEVYTHHRHIYEATKRRNASHLSLTRFFIGFVVLVGIVDDKCTLFPLDLIRQNVFSARSSSSSSILSVDGVADFAAGADDKTEVNTDDVTVEADTVIDELTENTKDDTSVSAGEADGMVTLNNNKESSSLVITGALVYLTLLLYFLCNAFRYGSPQ